MAWRFRKSFKLFPGLRLNIGKKGISSATIGKRGFTTSIGKLGVFQNLGIPGTGLSYRNRVGGSSSLRGAIIGLGVVASLLIGIISFCVLLAAIRGSDKSVQRTTPVRLITNMSPTPTPTPTQAANSAAKDKKNKRKPNQIQNVTDPILPKRSSPYTRGPRGGCYYINSSGRKTYVDRGMCS